MKISKMPKLLDDQVLIKLEDIRLGSGLIAPDTSRSDYLEATIFAAGPGKHNAQGVLIPMDLKVADKVLVSSRSKLVNPPLEVEGVEGKLYLINRDFVIGVI